MVRSFQPILHVWINHDSDLVDLTITTITKGEHGKPATKTSEVIHTNQKHPFFTMEHGFLPVGQIKLGMHILQADGQVGVVIGWKVVPGTRVMYNLEVAQDHTFTVGAGQWVVHNTCFPSDFKRSVTKHFIEQWVKENRGAGLSAQDLEDLLQNGSFYKEPGEKYVGIYGKIRGKPYNIYFDPTDGNILVTIQDAKSGAGWKTTFEPMWVVDPNWKNPYAP